MEGKNSVENYAYSLKKTVNDEVRRIASGTIHMLLVAVEGDALVSRFDDRVVIVRFLGLVFLCLPQFGTCSPCSFIVFVEAND